MELWPSSWAPLHSATPQAVCQGGGTLHGATGCPSTPHVLQAHHRPLSGISSGLYLTLEITIRKTASNTPLSSSALPSYSKAGLQSQCFSWGVPPASFPPGCPLGRHGGRAPVLSRSGTPGFPLGCRCCGRVQGRAAGQAGGTHLGATLYTIYVSLRPKFAFGGLRCLCPQILGP